MHKKLITSTFVFSAIVLASTYFSYLYKNNSNSIPYGSQKLKNLHVGIIMDGNRRWEMKQGQHVGFGHSEGSNTALRIIKHANKIGIGQLTLYALSIENLNRSKKEVEILFDLLRQALKSWSEKFGKDNIKIQFFGDRSLYPENLLDQIEALEESTKDNSGLSLNVLYCYGGEQELVAAVRSLAEQILCGELSLEEIGYETLAENCWTGKIGSPDLIIRTGGQKRMSNFMPMASRYSEIMFIDNLWPDFKSDDFDSCISDFFSRNRTFGL